MRLVFFSGWWLFGYLVLAGLILSWIFGDQLVLTRYTGYLMPWLLLGLVPGALWGLLAQQRALAALLGISVVIIMAAYAPLFWPRKAVSVPGAMELKVLSYNVWSKNSHVDRMAHVVRTEQPDLLLLQEITPKVFERLKHSLQGLYEQQDLHYTYEPKFLLAVVSRYPLEPKEITKGMGRVQKVVLVSPDAGITVYNAHFVRRGGWQRRRLQIATLLQEDIVHNQGPVILGGDFNTTDQSQTYGMLSKYLSNAHWQAGFGFGFTYPSPSLRVRGRIPLPALARIDHIFFNDNLVAIQAGTLKDSGGSDHFPVAAILRLKPSP